MKQPRYRTARILPQPIKIKPTMQIEAFRTRIKARLWVLSAM